MASPELQIVLDLLRGANVFGELDVKKIREAMAAAPPVPKPDDVEWTAVEAGGVPAEWNVPSNAEPGRVIVYLHGGGYGIGGVESHRGLCSNLARAARARVLNVGYRLAPEHPHPAALEDAISAWRFVIAEGADPSKAAIGGDSAGGGLAMAALVALRDAGDPLPAAAIGISPWTDLTLSSETIDALADRDPMISRPLLELFREAYLGDRDPKSPGASPIFADLRGLPPMLLHVGTAEGLLGDAESFAAKARAAGCDVTYEAWDDMIHVWHTFADLLPEGRQAIARIGEYLDARLA